MSLKEEMALLTLEDYSELARSFVPCSLAEREACLASLYYLLRYMLNRPDMEKQWLLERCREVQSDPDDRLDLWSREHYKDLANDTPMLTPDGWTTHGALKAGDYVYAPSGKAVRVQAVTQQYTDSECYRVTFADGAQLVAGAGHQWRVRQKIKRRIRGSDLRRVEWRDRVISTTNLPARADVGVLQQPVFGDTAQVPIDPYVLGVWLGDGSARGARITCGLQDADEMERLLTERGAQVARIKHSNAVTLRIGSGRSGDRSSSDFANALRLLGIYRKKAIPAAYLRASAAQRMELLRGLMDTDGHCHTNGTATFCNTNPDLVDQVYELATGLALRPRKRRYLLHDVSKAGGAYPYWQVCFQAHTDRMPFALARKAARALQPSAHRNCRDVVSVERISSVPSRCIQVEGGMYLAGQALVPTHNSTIVTFGLTIQDVLRDSEDTVGIFSHTRPIAKGFLRQIMREFNINERLKRTFPDVLWMNPDKEAPKYSEDDGIILKRNGNPKESTIEAWGLVDGQPTSKHFDRLVYDDVVVKTSVTTPEMMAKTLASVEESYNLGKEGGKRRFVGTRWHSNDAYKTIIERGTAKPRIRLATSDGTLDGDLAIWSRETLKEKRRDMGPYTFSCLIMQDPLADATQGFKRDWLRFYENRSGEGMNKYMLVDAANSKRKSSDYTTIWIVGLAADKNYYALDIVRDRLNLTERASAVMRLHRKWRPMQVRYESYGLQADIAHIKSIMEAENYRFDVQEVAGRTPKNDRIRRLIPICEQGKLYLPHSLNYTDYEHIVRDLVHDFIEEEYASFPVAVHDDMMDSLARIAEPDLELVWPRDSTAGKRDRYAVHSRPSAWAA